MAKQRAQRSLAARRTKESSRLISWRKLHVYLYIAAGLVFGAGLILSLVQWHNNSATVKRVNTLVSLANKGLSHAVPSTNVVTPSAFASYTVATDLPRYIFIPSINVQAIIRPLGITASGQLESPDNVFDVGWYNASSKPGQIGAMILDGHVSSWTAHGVFYSLKDLVAGDQIQIERGDGTMVTYTVVSKTIYSYQNVDMTTFLAPINKAEPGLNIITCTGDVIPGTNEFNERIAIFAAET